VNVFWAVVVLCCTVEPVMFLFVAGILAVGVLVGK